MRNINRILPIMFAYYVMGFSDITGIATFIAMVIPFFYKRFFK